MNAGRHLGPTPAPGADGDRAVSPVVGVLLLVALTVLLAVTVSVTVFGYGPGEAPPAARFQFEYTDGSGLTIRHEAGKEIPVEELSLAGTDPDGRVTFGAWPGDGDGDGRIGAGESVTIAEADGDETVDVVWTGGGAGRRSFFLASVQLRVKGQFAFQLTDGTATVEADEFTGSAPGSGAAAGDSWVIRTGNGASGGSYLYAEPNDGTNTGLQAVGPRVDYRIDFDEPGEYVVWVRMDKQSNQDDSVHVGLDGQLASGADHSTNNNYGLTFTSQPSGWQWTNSAGGEVVTVTVDRPGVHTLNVWMREDGTSLDQVVVTRSGYDPR